MLHGRFFPTTADQLSPPWARATQLVQWYRSSGRGGRLHLHINRYQLFGVAALAHRGLPPCRGFVREVPLAFPAPHLHALGL